MVAVRSSNSNICKAIFVLGFLLSQVNFAIAARTLSAGDLYFLAQKSYYQLIASPEQQKFRHHWLKTINMFSKVVESYPKSDAAYKAEFTIGKLFEGLNSISKNSKDLDQAIYYYNNVSNNYSSGNLSDDALFRTGEIFLKKKKLSYASETFKKIYEKYPKGDHAGKARQQYNKIAVRVPGENKNAISDTSSTKRRQPNVKLVAAPKHKTVPVLKNASVVAATSDKEKIVAEFKEIIQKQGKTNPPATSQVSKPTPAKNNKVVEKPSRIVKTAKAISAPPIRKKKNIEDGIGRGYLYNPKTGENKHTPLIVVDAGHGGKDHGAKSVSGIKEKDVNLTISRHVKTILVNRYKYRVVMTRKDDTFIPLKGRSEISNKRNADLFVSIHANAAKRKSAHGIETYFLGTSHNEEALETAARENGELVQSVKDGQVQQILASLITTTKINDSSRLAGRVQDNLFKASKKQYRNLKNLGVKEGPFYVLHGADMPSILVEVGFLTHREEAKMLARSDYLYRLASSIAEGIHKYLQDKGPSI